ncbi:FtsQ-type POTRA domain-containing protein [Ramlibacter sp. USB13]|uniref:Cell division protein FtsQ n=1 Tax=Ramlibacter cellulosilyticus TaxID=2764187 RepID=A0A923MYI1_9BURK|nr:cell division protein FtsQ/DivIB [Ramlibacter cellulosilyticus]MBC5786037.1 FtsQ-type POTRA domain-containing protein [Ramlibacter cellulosilyticus]
MKQKALPQPLDVRLMNITATVLFAACGLLLAAALGWWALRHPLFAIGGIVVQGDVTHNSAATLRANVAPRLRGNFFTVDLNAARQAFEAVPWVRQAVVKRQFPNKLRVQLQEHQPEAFWGVDSESRLVNTYGEVFEANAGDVEDEDMPRLVGPEGSGPQLLEMYRGLKPMLEKLDLAVEEVKLTGRGGWAMTLDSGAQVELGRGTAEEVLARSQRFASTLTQVTAKYGRRPEALVTADLRHTDGYAVKLRGVTTTDVGTRRN